MKEVTKVEERCKEGMRHEKRPKQMAEEKRKK